jgi:UDP-N-acetylglucosamine acyltransferase
VSIHPLAVVSPDAVIGPEVSIGPFCVIDSGVTIGARCRLESGVAVKSGTTLGEANHVFQGAVLGGLPQHAHMPENPGGVQIGSNNTIRENVTIHRALEAGHLTVLGDNCLLMVNAHIAHDCHLGNNLIITNNVMLAGHVTVEDRAYLSGGAAVHQFCRIGTLAMVGGQAHINRDIPPYVTVDGLSSYVVGLNQIGLRRAGFDTEIIRQLKIAYRVIYRSGLPWREILAQLEAECSEGPVARFREFLVQTKRGIVPERRLPPGATIKFRRGNESETQSEPELRIKAG